MFFGLLKESIGRINSLEHFYNTELKSILSKSKKGMKKNNFGYTIDLYFQSISRNSKMGLTEEQYKRLEKYVNEHITIIEKEETEVKSKIAYQLKNVEKLKEKEQELSVKVAAEQFRMFADMPIIHGSNTLIMLLTRFEEFISDYIEQLYIMFPQRYLDSESITFSEFSKTTSIDEIRRTIIDRQLDSIMRASYTEWFKLFSSHGIKLDDFADDMKKLAEIYARRNIWVHNSGRVNESYLKLVPTTTATKNEVLSVNEEYIRDAFATIKTIIVILMIKTSKLIKNNTEEYIQEIFIYLFGMLCNKEYSICEKAFSALSEAKECNAQYQLMSKINYWICIIEARGLQEVKKEIESLDVSALDEMFILAKLVLLEEYDRASLIIEQLLASKSISASTLEEWPLFIKYRKSSQYSKIKEKHPGEFNITIVELPEVAANTAEEKCPSNAIEIE